jgi:hypothetical protein
MERMESTGPTAIITIGNNPMTSNKSIVREKLNAQIHLLYTRKVTQYCCTPHVQVVMTSTVSRNLTNALRKLRNN